MVTYAGKLVLAPMWVRAGELPTRLMALAHGADLRQGLKTNCKLLITSCQSKVQTRPETLVFRTCIQN
nr:CMF_HP1_G0048220.mRNA.1.CDS.1 [Saccharomyces cerevisiae]